MGDRQQYFATEPAVSSEPTSVELVLPDLRLRLRSDRGVFARDGVDPGTKYLLLDAPPPPPGATRVVDIGCGYGPIAITLARRFPDVTVWAVDVNRRALQLCRDNADAAGVGGRVIACEPADVPATLQIDAAYTNPPLRIGRDPLRDLLAGWIERLTPGAALVSVVHKHLGSDSLHRWLDAQGWPTERLGSRSGYRLLRTIRAPADDMAGPTGTERT